jgi:hypothetical protein
MPRVKATQATLADLKKLFEANNDLKDLAPHVAGGVKILDYSFAAMDAASAVKPPHKGIELSAIEVRAADPNDEKSMGEVAVAHWMLECIAKQFADEDAKKVERKKKVSK